MKHLTNREEEIMERFWDRGALFVHDLIRDMDEPKPHYNTVSTIVRGLEEKGFVGHERFGTTYRYFPLLSREKFGRMSLQNAVASISIAPISPYCPCSWRRRKSLPRKSRN